MNDSLPPVMEEKSAAGRFTKIAATFSLLAPFAVFFLYLLFFWYIQAHGRTRIATLGILASLPLLLIILGIALGIAALVLVKRQEHKGIFVMASVGVCINIISILLLLVGPFFLALALSGKHPMTPEGQLNVANQKLKVAVTEEDRFYALDDAAKESFVAGKIEDARKDATELLSLASNYVSNWNYGNAIQDGNLVLGRIAVSEGRIEDAKQYLLAAGKSKGSPQMDSFGPNMSLAKDLLEKGERDTVLQYFELCRKFWTMDYSKLDDWSQDVKAGKIPDFGANLVY